ncbi:hypothetical protein FB45DRAFT_84529 [Roridomyces roridus]|uniref:Uncharacterized protein n=1 Tax=Roridomyces roridus TaxID=1738132 RepID=A0AAD7BLA9_9AGAR|nr:hypothetical protein FB45DRAFT_84529 [Roridomyces roridus]
MPSLPTHFTTQNFTGRFKLNIARSIRVDELLTSQGIQDAHQRLAIEHGELAFNHFKDDDGQERIWIEQDIEGQIPPPAHEHLLDWFEREHHDNILGRVFRRIKRVKTPGLEPAFLRAGWSPDTLKHGVLLHEIRNDAWKVVETWGVEVKDGERYFARHVEFIEPNGSEHETRLVYDYVGPIN